MRVKRNSSLPYWWDALWLVKKFAPLCQPVASKTETKILTHSHAIFHAWCHRIYFEIWSSQGFFSRWLTRVITGTLALVWWKSTWIWLSEFPRELKFYLREDGNLWATISFFSDSEILGHIFIWWRDEHQGLRIRKNVMGNKTIIFGSRLTSHDNPGDQDASFLWRELLSGCANFFCGVQGQDLPILLRALR